MHRLLKINKVPTSKSCTGLRHLYDQVEGHVRALKTAGVTSEHYGALLIPIIVERLPDEVRLEISRKLGTKDWKIDAFMEILKSEISARESCEFMKSQSDVFVAKEYVIPGKNTTDALFAGVRTLICGFCGQNHYHDRCNVVTDLTERKRIAYEKKLCFKCLSSSHRALNCRSKNNCYRCKDNRHHTALCQKDDRRKDKEETRQEKLRGGKNEENEISTAQNMVNSNTPVLLQTASGIIADTAERRSASIKILLDTGSQRTYLSEKIVKKLGLQPYNSREMTVQAFGDVEGKSSIFNEYRFCLKNTKGGENMYLSGFAVKHICSPLTEQRIDVAEELYPELRGLELSDVTKGNGDIELLIGADFYGILVGGGVKKCSEDGLTALNTKLGWVLFGPYEEKSNSSVIAAVNYVEVTENIAIETEDKVLNEVKKLWDLETLGIKENESSWVEKCIDKFEFVNGRYQIDLPFKENRRFMEDNFKLAENRLRNLKKKLEKEPEMLQKYDQIIKNQLDEGIVEKVKTEPIMGEVTYSPHRHVIREDKTTTKVRIVYDLSAKNKGPSINECLNKGPPLTPLLFDVLLRFRVAEIAMTGDIAQAYLQISVNPIDRDFLRFLWFDDVTKSEPEILKLRFTRVIFGAGPSQFLLNSVVMHHLEKYRDGDPELVKKLLRCFYVDDFSASVGSYDEAHELYTKTKSIFLDANFNLRKWRTNHPRLREEIRVQEGEASSKLIGGKVLGVIWNELNDELVMDFEDNVNEARLIPLTKRNLLRILASFFDPIGICQPYIVSLKILFQKICMKEIGWDEAIKDELAKSFYRVLNEMEKMGKLSVPRNYIDGISDDIVQTELHAFSDGSKVAYGCCVYLRFVKQSGDVKVTFVAAKSRVVSPKKKMTIPRTELLGNLIASRLVVNVNRALNEDLSINKILCWSDAKVTLAWINSVNKEFDTFVENRLIEIRKNVAADNWYYVKTEDNPADYVTRSGNKINDVWCNGPRFLYNSTVEFNKVKVDTEACSQEFATELRKKNAILLVSQEKSATIGNLIDLSRYNDYLKLLRITAYVLRYLNNLKIKRNHGSLVLKPYLNAGEINQAMKLWIEDNQRSFNNDDIAKVKYNLNLQKDGEGCIRSYSRLQNACIPHDAKAPIFINRTHRLAEILVSYYHLKVLHGGVKQTLTEMRSKYWIVRGRSFVKKVIRDCTTCKKINSRSYQYPNISQLPETRFSENFPFMSTGVDYLGPLYCLPIYGKDNDVHKAYVVLYTCTTTRAVILDVVSNATADNFLDSFKRFLARRGCPATVVSDPGSVFVADQTQKFAADRGITWKINLDGAAWFGGIWERLVASVKRCLKKIVGKKKLTFVELQTILYEIELVLNNRPIGVDFEDDQEDILTPNHLIFGRRLETDNDLNVDENLTVNNCVLVKRKKMMDKMLTHFWNRWRKEYVTNLREQQRISKQRYSSAIKINDIVIIYEDKQPRQQWKLGRVLALIQGRDKKVRGAEVKVGKSGAIIRRPVNRLYPIFSPASEVDQPFVAGNVE